MEKQKLLFLRFFLILSTILVMTYSKKGLNIREPGYIIALIYFISNFIFYRISDKYFAKPITSFLIFLFDIIAISLAIYFTQGIENDFYLIYFLVIFVSSVWQDIWGSIPIAIVASLIYGWLIYRANPGISLLESTFLIRIPFLFILSLISSYWAQTTRTELRKKDELERFNRELKKEVERVVAEETKLREYTEKVINSVPSGVIATRLDGIITTINPEAERVLGLKKEEAVWKNIKDIHEISALWQKMEECMNSRVSLLREEVSIQNRNNETIPIGLSLSPITVSKEGLSGGVAIFKDLSEIRALEEKLKQAEKLSYLGKMASWVAHEIRNPLAVILGFARLIVNTKKEEKITLYSSEISKGAQRIDYIIDDILTFARDKKKQTELQEINIRSLVKDIVRNFNIETRITGYDSPTIKGESESIRRVFVNLITNSVEAMKAHSVLQVNFSDGGKWLTTEIIDNGAGIPKENMKNLFTPFFTTKPRGTGLGLAIVKKILEEHNGKIEIESEEGLGTTCRVYLQKDKEEKNE